MTTDVPTLTNRAVVVYTENGKEGREKAFYANEVIKIRLYQSVG